MVATVRTSDDPTVAIGNKDEDRPLGQRMVAFLEMDLIPIARRMYGAFRNGRAIPPPTPYNFLSPKHGSYRWQWALRIVRVGQNSGVSVSTQTDRFFDHIILHRGFCPVLTGSDTDETIIRNWRLKAS